MIDRIDLQNFKRFTELSVRLDRLTLLTGVNSGGKSSLIQALLVLHSPHAAGGTFRLNGPHGLALGEANDVWNADAPTSTISITALIGGETSSVVFDVPDERSGFLTVADVTNSHLLASVAIEERGFVYLCAERLGPRDLQEVHDDAPEMLSVGSRGEFTAHVLSRLERRPIDTARQHPATEPGSTATTLSTQAELWMSEVVSPVQIQARWLEGTSAAQLRFRPPGDRTAEWRRPDNVGFGISYALPIVVAGLTAPPGGVLVVENPEAHLHPAGQSSMGQFLARVAAADVQVVVESHSDHLLNGIRRAVAVAGAPAAGDLVVHYFGAELPPVTLSVADDGAMSEWPPGFFDQGEIDLTELARARRSR